MPAAKNKTDLIIERWEEIDCESVGAKEIVAIETVVRDRFGHQAVDSPMVLARLLADEGAELRHSEIMNLYVERASARPLEAALNNLFDLSDLDRLERSLRSAENLRRKLLKETDNDGLRLLRQDAIETKSKARNSVRDIKLSAEKRNEQQEAAEWITLWLQSPELFENWVKMRRASSGFRSAFGSK